MSSTEATPAKHPALNERTQHLLKALVERYIRDGQPVGSRAGEHVELSLGLRERCAGHAVDAQQRGERCADRQRTGGPN